MTRRELLIEVSAPGPAAFAFGDPSAPGAIVTVTCRTLALLGRRRRTFLASVLTSVGGPEPVAALRWPAAKASGLRAWRLLRGEVEAARVLTDRATAAVAEYRLACEAARAILGRGAASADAADVRDHALVRAAQSIADELEASDGWRDDAVRDALEAARAALARAAVEALKALAAASKKDRQISIAEARVGAVAAWAAADVHAAEAGKLEEIDGALDWDADFYVRLREAADRARAGLAPESADE